MLSGVFHWNADRFDLLAGSLKFLNFGDCFNNLNILCLWSNPCRFLGNFCTDLRFEINAMLSSVFHWNAFWYIAIECFQVYPSEMLSGVFHWKCLRADIPVEYALKRISCFGYAVLRESNSFSLCLG